MANIIHLSHDEMKRKILTHAPGLTTEERANLFNLVADFPARLLDEVITTLKEIKGGQVKG